MEQVLKKIEEEIMPHVQKLNLELVDIEYVLFEGENYLRIYVEKLEGVTGLEECIALSEEINDLIDKHIDDKYFLEVSTPGIERILKKEKDFIRFKGSKAKIITKEKVDDHRNVIGIIKDFKDSKLFFQIDESDQVLEIELSNIKKANLVFEF